MSTPIELESPARQDFGPTTSASDFEPLLVRQLADSMSIPSVDVPPRAMTSELAHEADSTEPVVLQVFHAKAGEGHNYCDNKNEEFLIADALGEQGMDAQRAYTVIDPEDSDDGSYSTVATTAVEPAVTPAIVQNIAKLPQSYTLNVDATVTSIATIQSTSSVSSSGQMLLLPTILATGAPPVDNKLLEGAGSPTGISQIIITSDAYTSSFNQSIQRTNVLPETNFMTRPKCSKVQILSNISLPKTTNMVTYSQQLSSDSPLYNTSDHVYKLNTGVPGLHSKHVNNSVVNKTAKTPASVNYPNMTSNIISQAHIKSLGYAHTLSKGNNANKSNKVNNGTSTTAGSVVSSGNNQCHILSRVVSGPKLAVPPGRKGLNTFSKGAKNASQNTSGPKSQARSIKIIQQTATKPEAKNWNLSNTTSKVTSTYSVDGNMKAKASPTHKSSHALLSQKTGKNEQRVVLQSPCGPVLISTAPISISHHRPSHYVQSGTPSLRYVHNYIQQPTETILTTSLPTNQISANQHLTAQILQSLSQPKLMLQATAPVMPQQEQFVPPAKPVQHRRHISGDPTTLLTVEDIIGMEERPNLSEEIIRYAHDSLAFVMLDHTYALSAQKLSPVPSSSPSVIATAPPIMSPTPVPTPSSPVKSPPTVTSTVQLGEFQSENTSTGPQVPSSPVANVSSMNSFLFKSSNLPVGPDDDDAASAISSHDGRAPDNGGSDTETAPEVDDGKTRCICDFTHDDGYMICCDRCGEWQHVDCMGIDRNNIPDAYQCSDCQPRKVERRIARALQMRKREEFGFHGSGSESSDGGHSSGMRRKRLLTVTTYSDTSGACVTTYNNLPPAPVPVPPAPQPKRMKRPKKADMIRKVTKRKLTEKRVKRKKDLMMTKSKYSSLNSSQSSWHDAYEQAVTNHYSPELRAKIMRYGNKTGIAPNMAQAISAHYCTTVPHAGGKILIATEDLQENTPIVELRGKYMLSTQHRPQIQMSSRAGGQKPGPFVFFYRLPKDNTQVCIDTRTYGNEARFVRRSCKYNAELQHCIVKGTLHVYIVALGTILDGTEITVPHDHNGGKQSCACGNPKHCKLNGFNTVAARKAPVEYLQREKRSRHRRSSSSSRSPGSPQSPVPAVIPLQRRISVINTSIKSPVKNELTSPVKTWGTTFTDAPISDRIFKEEKVDNEVEDKQKVKLEHAAALVEEVKEEVEEEPPKSEIEMEKPQKSPEVKMELTETTAIKKETPRSPIKEIKEEIKKEEENVPIVEQEKISPAEPPIVVPPKIKEEEKVTRSVTARACAERHTRSSRAAVVNPDSMDEKTDDSQEKQQSAKDKRKMTREERKMEAIMRAFERMEKAEQRKQEVRERQSKRRESDPAPPTDNDEDGHTPVANKKRRQRKGRARTTSQNASRRRLNSADSDLVTSGDEALQSPPRDLAPPAPLRHAPTTPEVGLSSACLLVEAAVGPLESAFKLPKTKKTMANEWVGRSPEHTSFQTYQASSVGRSLESLVHVASSMIGHLGGEISEPEEAGSPPRTPIRDKNRPPKKMKRGSNKTPVPEQPVLTMPQHSAKKRWLRQAISEESDSPTAESPPSEMVTPLKKRRLARESLSMDQPINKPEDASPPIISEDSPTKEDVRDSITRHCKMKSRYIDSMYGSEYSGADHSIEAQNDFLNMNLKDPRDEKFNLDIRRIIGVPGSEETYDDIPMPKTPEERTKPIDVNDNEFHHNSLPEEDKAVKATPMEIDTEISPHRTSDIAEENVDKTNDTQTESRTSIHSNDTSGNSSPQRDEMDDIQKKIHSFHTENIQILKIRNKKPPKEKRKKVNLNFDLNMVDDQISIQLRTEGSPRPDDINGDVHSDRKIPIIRVVQAADTIPLPPPVEPTTISDANVQYIPWTDDIPLPGEPMMQPKSPEMESSPVEDMVCTEGASSPAPDGAVTSRPASPIAPVTVSPPVSPEKAVYKAVSPERTPTHNTFISTGLFSDIFNNMNTVSSDISVAPTHENVQHLNIMSTINKNFEGAVFSEKAPSTPVDELRNVQEILDRVNSMDANTSMILSGVLNADVASKTEALNPVTTFCARSVDPRLNPPPADKPKPVRRKLSITEYLKRHKVTGSSGSMEGDAHNTDAESLSRLSEWSSDSSAGGSRSPLRLDAAAAAASDELDTRLGHALKTSLLAPLSTRGGAGSTGEFDAQPTQLERQRENLSSRLRREFGLTLPDDDEARPPTLLQGVESLSVELLGAGSSEGCQRASLGRPPPLDR